MIGSQRKPMANSTGGGRGRSLLGGGLAKKRRMGSALFGARTPSGTPIESEAPIESDAPAESEAPVEGDAPVEARDVAPPEVDGVAFLAALAEPEIAGPTAPNDSDPPAPSEALSDPASWNEFDVLSIADDPSNDDMVSIPTPASEPAPASPEPPRSTSRGVAVGAIVLLVVGGIGAWWWLKGRSTSVNPRTQDVSADVAP